MRYRLLASDLDGTLLNDMNDISMVKAAGLGVAVANATDEVKEAARYETRATNNEDALLEVVERFM